MKEACLFRHKALKVCEEHLIRTKCVKKECENRHPRICRYFLRGSCWRGDSCFYLHEHESKSATSNERETQSEKDKSESFQLNQINENNEECANCKCYEALNACDQCGKYFCSDCEFHVNCEWRKWRKCHGVFQEPQLSEVNL